MIEPGDKIALAVSGGKDSLTMAYFLALKANSDYHINFDIHAVHIRTDFDNSVDKSGFEQFLKDEGIPLTVIDVPVLKRLKPGRKMNCYWCSSQRRMELMKFASQSGCNKIALGHHMDDILETFFMNMAYKGEMSTMLPVLKFDNYDQTLIRPLALVKEKEIIRFAEEKGISRITCTCNFDTQSKRKEMRSVINFMAEKDESIRDNLFKAMNNPVPRYMINQE
nr:tRNA 2-thiocytidine biosynthesis TtcA family protein [Spirochaeta isovalerica]